MFSGAALGSTTMGHDFDVVFQRTLLTRISRPATAATIQNLDTYGSNRPRVIRNSGGSSCIRANPVLPESKLLSVTNVPIKVEEDCRQTL